MEKLKKYLPFLFIAFAVLLPKILPAGTRADFVDFISEYLIAPFHIILIGIALYKLWKNNQEVHQTKRVILLASCILLIAFAGLLLFNIIHLKGYVMIICYSAWYYVHTTIEIYEPEKGLSGN